jgi:membrane-bound lytic murein transglycosylase B
LKHGESREARLKPRGAVKAGPNTHQGASMIPSWKQKHIHSTIGVLLIILTSWMLTPVETLADEAVEPYYRGLQKRLVNDGFDAEWIAEIYSRPDIVFETRNVSLYFVHNESKLNYDQFSSRRHLRNARQYMREHAAALANAEKAYGVAPEVITAIILVETKLGTYLGGNTIFNNLSTMAVMSGKVQRHDIWIALPEDRRIAKSDFEKKADRKSAWAYAELKSLLTYAKREGIDPASITGSYAGAMGIAQFMPSNVLAYAKDGNQDGRVDLFDHADAITSIASYLKHYGWKPGLSETAARKVIYHYNHSKYYVNAVMKISKRLKS